MAYQVFARKYRPQTFAEVVGQDHITTTLKNSIERNRLAQAYLLVGPRGTGKTSTARIMAKALNCANGPRIDFDPGEDMCVEIAEGRSLDVIEIDGASNNGVEQVRDLRDNTRYTPVRGKFKVYIIDEVHMLSMAAFNALLKTLEEPPAHVKFIFATTEVHKLPATILSRCQRFDFRRISDAAIAVHLATICEKEKVTAEPAALQALARHAEGGLRDAETALDQTISFYGETVREDDVLKMFGLTGLEAVVKLANALIDSDAPAALQQARELARAGKDLNKLTQELLKFFRNMVIHQLSPESLQSELTVQEVAALQAASGRISRPGALALLEELTEVEGRLRYALNKDVLFEVALIQMSQLKERVSLETILSSLAGAGKAAAPQTVASPRPVANVPVAANTAPVSGAKAEAAWKKAVEAFVAARPLEAETIKATAFKQARGDVLEILLPPALEKKIPYLRSPRNLEILENTLKQECGRLLQIHFLLLDPSKSETEPVSGKKTVPPPPQLTDEEFKNDPLIRQALELFEARIVRVVPASR